MNWVDAVLLVLFLLLVWAGTFRGLIMEIVDIVTVLGGFLAATHLYVYGVILLRIIFKKIPIQTAGILSFLTFFILCGILIMLLGAWLELASKIPIAGGVNRLFGGVFASVFGIVLLWGIVVLVNLAPFGDEFQQALSGSPSVKALTWFNPLFDLVFRSAASPEAYQVIHSVIEKAKF